MLENSESRPYVKFIVSHQHLVHFKYNQCKFLNWLFII